MIYQLLGAGILLAFYSCYFCKLFSQKKQGIQTGRLGKGTVGMPKWIELGLQVVSIMIPAAELACIVRNQSILPPVFRWIGAGFGFSGVAVFAAAMGRMGKNWRVGVPESEHTGLVTTGVYRYSRNPAFLGFDLVYIGIVYLFFSWGLFVLSLLGVLLLHLQIVNVEEPHLLAVFGRPYLDYQHTVNRYLGRKRKGKG